MANELTTICELSLNDSGTITRSRNQVSTTLTNKKSIVKPVSVTTTAAALDFTGLTTPKAVILKNLDPTNYVSIGPDSGGSMVELIRLLAGEVCCINLKPSVTIKAQANTATCVVQMMAVDT